MLSEAKKNILNFLLFQMGWLACLLLMTPWLLLFVSIILCIHFFVVVPHHKKINECLFLTQVLLIGFLLETFYLSSEVLIKLDQTELPPFWLLLMWLLFGSTFRYSMAWLRGRLMLASVFAMIVAPMSYMSGAALNSDIELGNSVMMSIFSLGLTWAIIFPVLLVAASPQRLPESDLSAVNK